MGSSYSAAARLDRADDPVVVDWFFVEGMGRVSGQFRCHYRAVSVRLGSLDVSVAATINISAT